MSLLATHCLLKWLEGQDVALLGVVGSWARYWVNETTADLLKAVDAATALSDIPPILVANGYDATAITGKLPDLLNKLDGWGILGATHVDEVRLTNLASLPSSYQMNNLMVSLSNACNFECFYCYNAGGPNISISPDALYSVLSQAIDDCGVLSVSFTGGESALYPQLVEAVEFVKARNRECRLFSNGSLLNTDFVARLGNAGLDAAAISIDTLDDDVFKLMTSSTTKPSSILETMRHCLDHSISVTANIVLVDGYNLNGRTLREIKSALNAIGVTSLAISEATPAPGNEVSLETLRDLEFQERLRECLPPHDFSSTGSNKGKRSDIFCGIGCNGVVIEPNGNVVPCPDLKDFVLGNIFETSLADIWCHSKVLERFRNLTLNNLTECELCSEREICRGGCRAKAFHYGGNVLGRDPVECVLRRVPIQSAAEKLTCQHEIGDMV